MATTTQDELYRTFLRVSGQQTSALSDVSMTLADLLAEMHGAQGSGTVTAAKTSASTPTPTGTSGGEGFFPVASTVLKSGLGLAPLVGSLIGLFGGGEPDAPSPLVKYALPPATDFQAAQTAAGITGVDFDQAGMPRSYRTHSDRAQTTWAPSVNGPTSGGASVGPAPQINVNVQAMDARSFMDRSNEIALAVRDAMLNMNAINDVVNEL